MVSMIVCMGEEHVIGADGKMPWSLPNDLKYFKEKTYGARIVMGRKTFESIGKALPGRKTIVLTKRGGVRENENVAVCGSVHEVISKHGGKDLFVVGGEEIYKQFMRYAKTLYVTKIFGRFEGDTWFPQIEASKWTLTSSEKGKTDVKNPYDYYFLTFKQNCKRK